MSVVIIYQRIKSHYHLGSESRGYQRTPHKVHPLGHVHSGTALLLSVGAAMTIEVLATRANIRPEKCMMDVMFGYLNLIIRE